MKRRRQSYLFIALSVFLHLVALIGLRFSHFQSSQPQKTVVEVTYIEPTPTDQSLDKAQVRPSKIKETKNQIVEQQKRINEEKPEDAHFLSAFDQTVLQQTRAELSGTFSNTAKGSQRDQGQVEPKTKGELPTLKDLAPKFALNPGPKTPESDENGDPSQTDDHLKDIKTGMQTLLSTREFVYYAYYNRIKLALRNHWEPNVREKVKIIYRQGRTIASAHDRVTQVLVTLNSRGELVKVEVLTQSGVEALDGAAIEAFRQAAPFPNPPKGMIESDGTVRIRWDFVLEA